uniref:BHLH domain-containing protein n=1 Tax=Rhabditophanes sp. KR3021 TaxID=114890 RepID=A0AC35TR36_9BILA
MQNYGSPSFVGQTYQFCNSRSAFLHQPSPLYPPSDLKGDLKLVKREYNENCSYSNTSSDDGIYHGKSQKANSRRYKTPSPQVLRSRRQAANQRERKRMNGLNDAFEQLRAVLPDTDTGRRYSKFETLHMAQIYMTQLHEILKNADTKEVSKK